MELYAGIDLHSNNSVVTVLDEQDRTVFAKRLANDLTPKLSDRKPTSAVGSGRPSAAVRLARSLAAKQSFQGAVAATSPASPAR